MMLSSIKLVVIVYVKTLIMFNTIIRTGPRTTHVVRAGDLVPEGGTMLVTPGLDVQTRLEANLEGCEMVINALPWAKERYIEKGMKASLIELLLTRNRHQSLVSERQL